MISLFEFRQIIVWLQVLSLFSFAFWVLRKQLFMLFEWKEWENHQNYAINKFEQTIHIQQRYWKFKFLDHLFFMGTMKKICKFKVTITNCGYLLLWHKNLMCAKSHIRKYFEIFEAKESNLWPIYLHSELAKNSQHQSYHNKLRISITLT